MERIRALSRSVFLLLLFVPTGAGAQTGDDNAAIRAAALDYIEGWYAGNAERMDRAVHPELAKRIVRRDPASDASSLGQQSAMTARWNGSWKIVNVRWELKPKQGK